ncbi:MULTISPECIES: AAA family ATPase [Paenibacillus]|uniref:AAA family ATPase n=3 Tax=Paenibacillus TaxID=44249 RepID=A0ABX7LHD6_9BACL|nr:MULTISPECIES: AAA family ATPase [Paenibacillus]MDF9839672.1 putative ATP-dependent endonuclease of OLD family [Paenibacillus sp. PastF-2]MDF9846252.1 putative ATP-dependent endonuclease of OLD family [Paenibacillus sp. PastM-2]MDF9852825.1 putative ATP-dependent endonuclease of OLD family [Paenibacillus sp. PastF-1]MDH6477446.1 putative ATP-dependent endonuclease of OLD family [Paenibacillus sp. PastH-2]QSF47513.1 AAA family ATPase [Paenibacillus tianjinensis]
MSEQQRTIEPLNQGRPRLKQLIIQNFRGIGNHPVTIELDKIVVLVGPNNVGKSSILRAYEVAMSEGSNEAILLQDDFPGGVVHHESLPMIELHTVIQDHAPGARWIHTDSLTQEKVVKERWTWAAPGAPKRQGFDVEKNIWAEDAVPWGAPNVANYNRPKPHRVDAFSDPKVQADVIVKLLSNVIKERVKDVQEEAGESQYKHLLRTIATLRQQVISESIGHIEKIELQVSELLSEVFPGYVVKFDPRAEEEAESDLNLFQKVNNAQLKMGHGENGHLTTLDRQGSGARRTLLWSALRMIAETNVNKGAKKGAKKEAIEGEENRPHVLLLDEPELCLHPNAVREACRVLYDLPNTGNWQVIVTTHSPAFIDVSRDNTTIIRVEQINGHISGTTVFRPERVKLDDEDRSLLKLMNIFDPYVAEFFFGGRCIIVEGDTEYTAFKHIMATKPGIYKDVHIIRARGKATIVSLVKILNHFGSRYSVLHDSDTPTTLRKGKTIKNPAWAHNEKIYAAIQDRPHTSNVRLLASLGNFEKAYFGEEVSSEKPYNAIIHLQHDEQRFEKVEQLLDALLDHSKVPPEGALEWTSIAQLEEMVAVQASKELVAAGTEDTIDEVL